MHTSVLCEDEPSHGGPPLLLVEVRLRDQLVRESDHRATAAAAFVTVAGSTFRSTTISLTIAVTAIAAPCLAIVLSLFHYRDNDRKNDKRYLCFRSHVTNNVLNF